MSKQASQSNKWQFTVTQRQLPSPIAGKGPLPFYGNFRDDTGACLGVTTEQYGIIQNEVLMNAAYAALEARGLTDYSQKILVTGDAGQRFYAEFTFANRQLACDVGDVFGYRLTLRNSFDRSIRAAFTLGFLRLTCKNGASTLEKEFGATQKHSTNVNVDFVGKAIDLAMARAKDALKVYDAMANVPVSDEQGVNILNQFVLIDALSGSMRDSIKTLWLAPRRAEDKARNLYTLYNAVTEHLTHQVADSRFEYADKVSSNILLRLVNVSRSADKLAKLILPVPAPNVAVTVDAAPIATATNATVIEAEVVS